MEKLAIVRIRGIRKINPKIKRTLEMLRLNKPNHCVVVNASPQTLGMIRIVKDYVAYGSIDEKSLAVLIKRKGESKGSTIRKTKKDDEIAVMAKEIIGGKKTSDFIDPVFRLHPPRRGYRDTKRQYPAGDLGKRDDMVAFVKRMM